MNTTKRWWLYQRYSARKAAHDTWDFTKRLIGGTLRILWQWIYAVIAVPFVLFYRVFMVPLKTLADHDEATLKVIDARVKILHQQLRHGRVDATDEELKAAGFTKQEAPAEEAPKKKAKRGPTKKKSSK